MFDKRQKMWGVPVSKEEALQSLGDPGEWDRAARQSAFRNHERPGQEELDIAGIQGCPSGTGYLQYLRDSIEHPEGVGTGLVSEERDAEIRALVLSEAGPEVIRYEALLARLEKSPEAIREHLVRLKWHLELQSSNIEADPTPEEESMEEMRDATRQWNEAARQKIRGIREDIERYSGLLSRL